MHLNEALSSPDSRIVSFLYANSSLDFVLSRTSLFVHFTFLLRIIYVALRRGLAKQRRQRMGGAHQFSSSWATGCPIAFRPNEDVAQLGPTQIAWANAAQQAHVDPAAAAVAFGRQRQRPASSAPRPPASGPPSRRARRTGF